MQNNKYSLWLMPSGGTYKFLKNVMDRLSESYKSKIITPHTTLLGSLEFTETELLEKTKDLASTTQSFIIRLTNIGYSKNFYRALFVYVSQTQEILNAHKKAKKLFGIDQVDFMPHLSLFYGEGYSIKEKELMIRQIGTRDIDLEFLVDRFHIFRVNNERVTSVKVDEIPLLKI
jgi:2'-5' RNA ligase